MSKIALTGHASGSGTLTFAAPNTNTDRTLTLPDSAGTLATSESVAAAGYTTSAGVLSQFNATGSAPVYACRAWVNFNGTGTVAIRASGNVSSITDNGMGDYTINFTTAMPDANYSTQMTTWYGSDSLTPLVGACGLKRGQAPTTSTVRVQVVTTIWSNGGVGTDVDGNYVAIFR